MQEENKTDYGPLTNLIGTWSGNKGKDIAPEPDDGTEHNEYYETLIFTAADDLANAEEENLSAVHYVQKVKRISNDEVIHQETGYWIWEQGTDNVMHSFTTPRGICVLAGGKAITTATNITLNVEAEVNSAHWPITQSSFLQRKATVKSYCQQITFSENMMHYNQTMMLDIYGRSFDHNDENRLTKIV
jgi:hypothetical protein